MGFNVAFPLANARPAEYNPRRITPDVLLELRASLRALGFVKPIIVRESGLIVAGHQRTKAAGLEGFAFAPAFVIEGMNQADEIRFNQLHNGCEIDLLPGTFRVPAGAGSGWEWIDAPNVAGPDKPAQGAAERHEILRLLAKYGHFSSAVATESGEIVAGQLYVSACRVMGLPLLVRRVAESEAAGVRRYLGGSYGQYSYDDLPRNTWHQSMAQMSRLAGEAQLKSTLFEQVVMPRLKPGMRILDFGAGKMAYSDLLRSRGFDVTALEFYRRRSHGIDTRAVNRDITALLDGLGRHGRFDFVVCDSVLNSIDSAQAEASVLGCLNAFTRLGGLIAFSGRPRWKHGEISQADTKRHGYRQIEFLDDDGYSAIYRAGMWQYQKFHTTAEARALAMAYVGPDYALTCGDSARPVKDDAYGTSWQVFGVKSVEIDRAAALAAIEFEFNLHHPGGSYNRGADARAAWLRSLSV